MKNDQSGGTKQWRVLALIGIFGSFLSVMADLCLAFFPKGIHGFETVFTVDVTKVFTVLSQASHLRLLLSNYIAMVGIPLGWAGMFYVYLNLKRNGKSSILSRGILVGSAVAYLCGAFFHVSLSYIATAFRLKENVDDGSRQVIERLIDHFIDFSQPLAYVFQIFIPLISIAFFALVVSRRSRFPVWLCVLNPLVIELIIAAAASLAPLALKTFLTTSVYNFSFLIFYSVCLCAPKRTDLSRP